MEILCNGTAQSSPSPGRIYTQSKLTGQVNIGTHDFENRRRVWAFNATTTWKVLLLN